MDDLHGWRVFDAVEPIGDVRIDALVARLCSTIWTTFTGKPAHPSEYIPIWGKYLEEFEKVDAKTKIERVRAVIQAAKEKKASRPTPPPKPALKRRRQKNTGDSLLG